MGSINRPHGIAPMLRLTDVHAAYGKQKALNGVSLEVNQGEIVALIGPAGSGKSTVLRLAAGEASQTSGKIEFEGNDIAEMTKEQMALSGVGYTPERLVDPSKTVLYNLSRGQARVVRATDSDRV